MIRPQDKKKLTTRKLSPEMKRMKSIAVANKADEDFDGSTLDYNTVYIETVRSKLLDRNGQLLKTPVAQAIDAWIDYTTDKFGIAPVVYACEKALEDNPYLWEEYIYDSDQNGFLTNDTLSILNAYAETYIENYKRINFDSGEFDDTVGDEFMIE